MCKRGSKRALEIKIPSYRSQTHKAYIQKINVDSCLYWVVKALNEIGVNTTYSCCGHGEGLGKISLEDGRHLLITPDSQAAKEMEMAYAPRCASDKKLKPSKKQGNARRGVKSKWQGLHSYRYSKSPLELKFAKAWQSYNEKPHSEGMLDALLERGTLPNDSPPLTAKTAANTIIQWLGSQAGQGFLRDVMNEQKGTNELP